MIALDPLSGMTFALACRPVQHPQLVLQYACLLPMLFRKFSQAMFVMHRRSWLCKCRCSHHKKQGSRSVQGSGRPQAAPWLPAQCTGFQYSAVRQPAADSHATNAPADAEQGRLAQPSAKAPAEYESSPSDARCMPSSSSSTMSRIGIIYKSKSDSERTGPCAV